MVGTDGLALPVTWRRVTERPPNRKAIGALIGKAGYNAPFDVWTVNDVINYARQLGFQPGEATMIPRLVSAMDAGHTRPESACAVFMDNVDYLSRQHETYCWAIYLT